LRPLAVAQGPAVVVRVLHEIIRERPEQRAHVDGQVRYVRRRDGGDELPARLRLG
jgi:hypothetical protein